MSHFDPIESTFKVMMFFIPFLFALCFHEFAHGLVAKWKGDRTAEMMGRLTLNPLAHADPIGTFLFPIVAAYSGFPLFGWAKPVPVNERNLKRPLQDMFWISLAGPASNLLLAVIGAFALGFYFRVQGSAMLQGEKGAIALSEMIQQFVSINIFLAIFNLIPLHPLDGGKVIAPFLPPNANRWLEEMSTYTGFLLMAVFVMGGGFFIIGAPAHWLSSILFHLAQGVASA